MASSSHDDETAALMALLDASAARASAAAFEHTALVERQEVQRAEFSARVEAEVAELETAREQLLATRTAIDALRTTAETDAATIVATATDAAGRANAARLAAQAAHASQMLADEQALQDRLAAMEATQREREKTHVAGLAAHTAAAEARLATHTAGVDQKIAQLQSQHIAALAGDRARFAAECAAKEQHLETLEATERVVQARAAALATTPGAMAVLSVGGSTFAVAHANLAKHPQSALAVAVHAHLGTLAGGAPAASETAGAAAAGVGPTVVHIDGDPTHFQLICNYLRSADGNLPVVGSASELRWLEREARQYRLDQLVQLCQDG